MASAQAEKGVRKTCITNCHRTIPRPRGQARRRSHQHRPSEADTQFHALERAQHSETGPHLQVHHWNGGSIRSASTHCRPSAACPRAVWCRAPRTRCSSGNAPCPTGMWPSRCGSADRCRCGAAPNTVGATALAGSPRDPVIDVPDLQKIAKSKPRTTRWLNFFLEDLTVLP